MSAHTINLETPITLDELLDRTTRETLIDCSRDLGFELAVIDRDGKVESRPIDAEAPKAQ